MKIRLSSQDLWDRLIGNGHKYPKYVSPVINLANRFAQATRPKHVGQVTDLIQECPARDYDGWRAWYLSRYPTAIDEATDRVVAMMGKIREAMGAIDRETIRRWVTELVLQQTYVGLRVERAILESAANELGIALLLSSPEDEARGIDGYLGGHAVSVKPDSYRTMDSLGESIDARMIYYEKLSNGTIVADLGEIVECIDRR